MDVEANPGPGHSAAEETTFERMEAHISHLADTIHWLTEKCAILESKCEQFQDYMSYFDRTWQTLDDNLDRLESFSRQNNIRFFNVYEEDGETYTDCIRKIVQLLNRFYPCKTWSADDVERAHRVGRKRGAYPRTLIARLHRWNNKLSVLNERDSRKDLADSLNIRVATDLTTRQQNVIREEERSGRRAYFRNGRLHVNENRSTSRRLHSQNNHHHPEVRDSSGDGRVSRRSPLQQMTGLDNKSPSSAPSPYDMDNFPPLSRRKHASSQRTAVQSSHSPSTLPPVHTDTEDCNIIQSMRDYRQMTRSSQRDGNAAPLRRSDPISQAAKSSDERATLSSASGKASTIAAMTQTTPSMKTGTTSMIPAASFPGQDDTSTVVDQTNESTCLPALTSQTQYEHTLGSSGFDDVENQAMSQSLLQSQPLSPSQPLFETQMTECEKSPVDPESAKTSTSPCVLQQLTLEDETPTRSSCRAPQTRRRRSHGLLASSSYSPEPVSLSRLITYDTGRLYSNHYASPYYTNGSPSLTSYSQSLDSGSRNYYSGSDVMSRYSSRSLDVGSTRYDSSSSYKGYDSSSMGSYRSSNLTGYGSSHGYGTRSDRLGSYSSNGSTSTSSGLASSRLHGTYSSRSSAADSVPLPRSSSFGRTEVLSSSTPRDQVDKGNYSSSLSRTSSLPAPAEEPRSSRYSSKSSTLTSNHSIDTGNDAASERRLRLAQRRRQREERGYSETSSDNSKEPSVERASSLRRDSDSDGVGTLGSSLSRRWAGRRLRDSSVTEESEGKESSPDVAESSLRRSRRLRSASGSSEDSVQAPSLAASTTLDSASVSETRASQRRRRQQEESEASEKRVTGGEAADGQDSSLQRSSEARRSRRQQRLEAASREVSGSQNEEVDRNGDTSGSVSGTTTRSWRQRLQEQGISGVTNTETDDTRSRRRRSQEGEQRLEASDTHTKSLQQSQDVGQVELPRRRSLRGLAEGSAEEAAKVADAVATEVETRAERIARYKEERRKQLAHIASITSGSEEKEPEALPSLFTSAKREKEDSPSDSAAQTSVAPESSLTSRLRALRIGSEELVTEPDLTVFTTAPESVSVQPSVAKQERTVTTDVEVKTKSAERDKAKSAESVSESCDSKNTSSLPDDRDRSAPSSRNKRPSSLQSSRSSVSSSQVSTTSRTSSADASRLRKSPSPASVRKPLSSTDTATTSSAATGTGSLRKTSTSFREPSPKKVSAGSSETKSSRKPSDSSAETRKSKSPSPVTSRWMSATKSSAAKGIQSSSASRGSVSPRSSPSPRGSPSPGDKPTAVTRSSSTASGTKGPPKIKQTLMPERGAHVSDSGKSVENSGKSEAASNTQQAGSKYFVRLPMSQQATLNQESGAETRQRDRESPQRTTKTGTNATKLSSSSFSATSARSTDRDSGFDSSRLSSSSFSSTRSPDKETAGSRVVPTSKASRLQRTARVEVSSSSSREGSEEKQLKPSTGNPNLQTSKVSSSVKRTSSLPSRKLSASGGHQLKVACSSSGREPSGSQPRDRKLSSSSPEKETSSTQVASVSQKSRSASVSSKQDETTKEGPSQSGQDSKRKPLAVKIPADSSSTAPLGSPGGGGLDDILAKNAEFLSSDEEVSGRERQAKGEQRRLRAGEEPKLRRSLRRKLLHKSGSSSSSSRDDVGVPSRESKEKGKEVEADVTATVTLPAATAPASLVEKGEVVTVAPSPAVRHEEGSVGDMPDTATEQAGLRSAEIGTTEVTLRSDVSTNRDVGKRVEDRNDVSQSNDDVAKGREDRSVKMGSEGRWTNAKKKEVSPDSDSVFDTAPSAPSSVETQRRRREDKSNVRKSDLNKASAEQDSAHARRDQGGGRGEQEGANDSSSSSARPSELAFPSLANKVSDIRSRFAGGWSSDKGKSGGDKASTVSRHPSRGKEFSQLLHKFSSNSEASSSERSDSDSNQHRRVLPIRRQEAKEGTSSSDDALSDSCRRTPERSQSLKVARSVPIKEESKVEKSVERAGSFKSDFMRKRFSPVPQNDAPSTELSAVLNRRQKEVELQQEHDESDKRGDRREARAERFKTTAVEEVIADSEVAAVLRARRKETDSKEDSQSGFTTIDQSLAVLARVTDELQDDKESSPETERLRPAAGKGSASSSRKSSKESLKEAEQLISDVQTRISSSLHLTNSDKRQESQSVATTKESSPSSDTLEYTVSLSEKGTRKDDDSTDVSFTLNSNSADRRANIERPRTLVKEPSSSRDTFRGATKLEQKDTDSVTISLAGPSSVGRAGSGEREKPSPEAESHTFTITSSTFSPVVSADLKSPSETSTSSLSSSTSSLRRTESLKEQSPVKRSESFERRKGILKRTPSMPKQESRPAIDPQLSRIMEQRRQKELELEAAKEEEEDKVKSEAAGSTRHRAPSAAEEIEEGIRRMRESQQNKESGEGRTEQSEEEAALCMSVSDRIFKMQSKIEEERHASVTPRSHSGATTPKSARSWSGSITPRKQISVDEGVSEVIPEEDSTTAVITTTTTTITPGLDQSATGEMSGHQLMERLNTLAAKSAEFEERRHKFQKRQREDWRTRTQPVTLEEIQQADSLDSVSAFRAQVRRNASKNIFDHLKTQEHGQRPLPAKGSEFPQHLTPEKRRGRGRHQRHKTLPVTAEELKAIPEGELLEPVPLRDTHDMWKRDSRTDSGILSGSEVESLGSDSLRSLSLEMDVSDNDPSRLSVSSKTSIFRSMDERARTEREKEKSASGAKRYIDRKKRERSRTQPVTDDEVKTAAEMSDEKKPATVRLPQPEVVNRPKSPSVDQEGEPEEDDQLTKLSLAEKVKLFSQKQKEEREAASAKPPARTDAPVPRRRQRKQQPSRFNTQPVTPEELAKASKISPLAMSLVKPPDPELLMGLKLKDQQELMMMHAEATLSQCSSRSGSRPSSQSGSRRGSFTTPDTLAAGAEDGGGQGTLSEKEPDKQPSTTSTATSETTTTTASSRRQQASSQNELHRRDSEPRGILKKTKSTESVPSDYIFKPIQSSEATTVISTESSRTGDAVERSSEAEGDRVSPVVDLVLPAASAVESQGTATTTLLLEDGGGMGGESTTDPVADDGVTPRTPSDKRRSRMADRKSQAERYLTQPAPQLTPERSPQTKRKYEGRHMTQPITPDEMKEAESATTPNTKMSGGSIADRLNQLKTSGEENWKRRVPKDKDTDTPVLDVKLRERIGVAPARPVSISDRLLHLEVSSEKWKGRVEETDAKHFTVASKLSKTGSSTVAVVSESPLVAKIRASSKKDLTKLDDSSNASSPVNSPSTPTKEFLPKVPLPKEIIADPVAVKKAEEVKAKQKLELARVDSGAEDGVEPVRVAVPTVDDAELEQFFSTKEISEIVDKVDMDIDDFNDIFVEANEILQSVKKIRPARKKKATSRNPLKTVSQFVEIQTEYTQISTGAAEKHLRKMKTEGLKREAGFAVEALAGLASKENFSKVELRKTEPSSLPASLAMRQNPFSDLMLLHIKGRRNVQTRLVEPSGKSMNAGDCFILVTPDKVIQWLGEFSNIIEKAKAAEVATIIQQKRDMGYKNTALVQTVEQAKDHLGAGKYFWAALRGEKECQAYGQDEEDELYESSIIKTNMVYRLQDGALHPYEQYWGAIPKHEMLDKKEVLVFDFGSEFYVWQGTGVSPEQRKQGMALAQKLWDKGYDYTECAVNPMGPLRSEEDGGISVKAPQRPDWAIFGKVNQNMETILFREKFGDWPDTSRLIGVKTLKTAELKCEYADIKAYDAKKMTPVNDSPVTLMLEGAHVGRGKKWQEDMQGFIKEQDILTLGVKVWHVLEYEHFQMPEASYGQFHRGDTYVVRWQYMITNAGLRSLKGQAARHSLTGRERCAYFFWQGQDSTINEKGASALMTVELDEERGPQVRVVQGKEPPCFLNLFEGSMIVHIGKREDAATNTVGPWRLYCLRGEEAGEVCLLEIPISVTNLRSRSSLVLLNTRTGITYVWHGVKSPAHTRQLAVNAVKAIKEKRPLELDLHKDAHVILTEVEEGEEKAEIWSAVGSRDRCQYHNLLTDPARYDYTPRLFYMTSVSMVFEVKEQLNPARLSGVTTPFPFFQADLYKASQPALFLLDVGSCVYLWQGWWPVGDEEVENVHTGSATARYNIDRRCAMETTLNYCKERGSGNKVPEAYLVCAGVEPLAFQNLFPYWETDPIVHSQAMQDGKCPDYCEHVEDVYTKLTQTRYTLEQLQERPLPDGVDPLKLESYLHEEEFKEVLEMSRDEFYALPTWKQGQLKQSLGLF